MKRRTFLKLMSAAAVSVAVPAPLRALAAEQIGLPSNPLVGEIRPIASGGRYVIATERGWLQCDGAKVERREYPQLAKVIGHVYGGTRDEFRLPDMRMRRR